MFLQRSEKFLGAIRSWHCDVDASERFLLDDILSNLPVPCGNMKAIMNQLPQRLSEETSVFVLWHIVRELFSWSLLPINSEKRSVKRCSWCSPGKLKFQLFFGMMFDPVLSPVSLDSCTTLSTPPGWLALPFKCLQVLDLSLVLQFHPLNSLFL